MRYARLLRRRANTAAASAAITPQPTNHGHALLSSALPDVSIFLERAPLAEPGSALTADEEETAEEFEASEVTTEARFGAWSAKKIGLPMAV